MKPVDLIKKLHSIPKSFFSLADIEKLYEGKAKNLPIILNRMVKKGSIVRIMRGYYTLDSTRIDYEEFSCTIKKPSYISLESALYHHGLIDQVPENLTLVSVGKSQVIQTSEKVLEYAHIKKELYFGYEVVGNTLIASKEKAILDELYLIALKKRSFDIDPAWFKQINRSIFFRYLSIYPSQVQRKVKQFQGI